MSSSKIRVVRGPTLRGKIKTVVGIIPAETLVLHHFVPHRNVLKNEGYQRNPTESRISQLARELKLGRVDLPTSVLLNLRCADSKSVLRKQIDPDSYTLELDSKKAESEHRLFVVDGQHRIRALQKAIIDLEAHIENIKIPFVCMIGADESREMEQFHVVNSNAKSVPTDLALALLKARAQDDPEFANLVEQQGRKWQIDAQKLVEQLAVSSSMWKSRIRLPNQPKGDTTVPSASFVRSLKPLLTQTALFRSLKTVEKQAQVIDAYWKAIGRVFPEAFENPIEFNIQKGVGVEVMHSIFPVVIDLARSNSDSLFKPESYVEFLQYALIELDGLNGEGQSVRGIDFWRLGRNGAAGAFSSSAGKRRLAEYLQHLLPELDL